MKPSDSVRIVPAIPGQRSSSCLLRLYRRFVNRSQPLFEQGQDFFQRGDYGAIPPVPVSPIPGWDIIFRGTNEDRVHAEPGSAGELLVGTIADVETFVRFNSQLPGCQPIDTRVGLVHTCRTGKYGYIKQRSERGVFPDSRDFCRAAADEGGLVPFRFQMRKDFDGTRPWYHGACCEGEPYPDGEFDFSIIKGHFKFAADVLDTGHGAGKNSGDPLMSYIEPQLDELIGWCRQDGGHLSEHVLIFPIRQVLNQRTKEVEDDGGVFHILQPLLLILKPVYHGQVPFVAIAGTYATNGANPDIVALVRRGR